MYLTDIYIVFYMKTDTKSQKSDDQSQYLYDLIGVTVHTGTADGGHYYSFIKDRTHSSEDQNRWYMFNDAEVKPFDSAQLASECFGGEMTVSGDGSNELWQGFWIYLYYRIGHFLRIWDQFKQIASTFTNRLHLNVAKI